MFTGLVQGKGRIEEALAEGRELDLLVDLGPLAASARPGDSVALSGVCCTIARLQGKMATFRLSAETLGRTWLGQAKGGAVVNLEGALRAGDPLGGHLVQGHVDGVGEVAAPVDGQAGGELVVLVPRDLLRYCVEKGSIAVDGVSLTIAGIEDDRVMAAIIPHTATATTLGEMRSGQKVNLEVDMLAKYVERLLEERFGGGGA